MHAASFIFAQMLRQLYIRDYALIEEVTIAFERGLNIITGETGAGKSIVLGAFGLLMGDRASIDVIRSGGEKTIVEAEFLISGNPRLSRFLEVHELVPEQDVLIVRREVLKRGTTRGFINDTPATAQLLKELAGYLVDLHGQHEHQSLLRAADHIVLLDGFGGHAKLVANYQSIRERYNHAIAQLASLRETQAKSEAERDLHAFQLNEIDGVAPRSEEDVEIERELNVLEHAEELQRVSAELHGTLYADEGSVYESLAAAKMRFDHLAKIDASLAAQLAELNSAMLSLEEVARFLGHYADAVAYDPARLQSMRERSLELSRIKRKYGPALADVIARREQLQTRLASTDSLASEIAEIVTRLTTMRAEAANVARQLTEARNKTSAKLAPLVVKTLKELGIEKATFEVKIEQRSLESNEGAMIVIKNNAFASNQWGMDWLEFYLSTNVGEPPRPLAKVASGGEISRVMLALKTLLAKNDRLPLMVFDEIDVGVSGRIAQKVGRTMKLLSADHQIIAISHLSQIAAFADTHFVVEKKSGKQSTTSRLRRLSDAEHIEEVARLISGEDISEASLLAARSLIREAVR